MADDAWTITPKEAEHFMKQFQALNPINGHITGDQAKGFLLKSQLPPPVLGQIWGLADRDADGKMDIKEFSIACKLIMLKLRGAEIPKALPANMLMQLASPPVAAAPIVPPMAAPIVPPMAAPIIPPMAAVPPAYAPMMPPPMAAPAYAPMMPPPMAAPAQAPMMPPPMVAQQPPMVAAMPMGVVQQPPMVMPMQMQPVQQVPPEIIPMQMMSPPVAEQQVQVNKQRSASVASVESGASLEWSVPHQSKLRYTQVFNSNDRTRCGHLTGSQARNILIQWGIPQAALAKIWSLSDLDSDGRLSCEEFVLAMHLCECSSRGELVPTTLPPDLIPPSFKRTRLDSLKTVSGTGTPTEMLSGPGSVDGEVTSPTSQSSFDDKRKQNYERGQAELERRRRALLEVQKKEQEERERKEREEHEKRERVRLEQERKQQEEIERQKQMQREMEEKQEEDRIRAQELKETARRESEKQRQVEWEKQKSQELQQQRQKEQEKVLQLKSQNQNLGVELSQRNEKVRELSQKISETRAAVAAVKMTIDGMRSTRDEQMAQMSSLKMKLREQNQRLVVMSQEKMRMDARNKANGGSGEADFKLTLENKRLMLNTLQDKLNEKDKENDLKKQDIKNNNSALSQLKRTLKGLLDNCEDSYTPYEDKRQKVCIMKNRVIEDINSQWGDSGTTAWGATDTTPAWQNNDSYSTPAQPVDDTPVEVVPGMTRYRALFEFVARNGDELAFQPGDVILVPDDHNAEPGWLAGKLRDATGWFPESYVERLDDAPVGGVTEVEAEQRKPLEGIAEVPETMSDNSSMDSGPVVNDPVSTPVLGMGQPASNIYARALYTFKGKKDSYLSFTKGDVITITEQQEQWSHGQLNGQQGWLPNSYVKVEEAQAAPLAGEYYMSMYPYDSAEAGDLHFGQGEMIFVTSKDGEWWTGTIDGTRTGLFPGSFASKVETDESAHAVNINAAVGNAAQQERQETQAEKAALHDEVKQIIELQNNKSFKEKTESVTTPDSQTSKSPLPQGKGKKPEIAQVLAPYKATSTEQLSLNRGQLVMVRKKTSSGWWEGELQAKGKKRQVGWFPASYVKLLVSSGTASGRTTPTARFRETPSPMPGKDRVIAMYSYVAQNADELSFDKDEVITIISQEDPSWWKGELQGIQGLFPSNYVSQIPTDSM